MKKLFKNVWKQTSDDSLKNKVSKALLRMLIMTLLIYTMTIVAVVATWLIITAPFSVLRPVDSFLAFSVKGTETMGTFMAVLGLISCIYVEFSFLIKERKELRHA